jgi:hypothetical protein
MILTFAYLLNIIDYLFTSHWVNLYGISVEGNPLGRWLFENGVAWVFKIFVVGGLLALLGVCIRIKPKLAPVAIIPLAVYGLIVLYHIAILIYIN